MSTRQIKQNEAFSCANWGGAFLDAGQKPNNPSLEYTLHMICPTPLSTPFTAADLSHAGLPADYTIPTKINIVNFRKELRHHPNGALVQWALAGFEHGFRIGYNGSRDGEAHRNLKSAEQYPQVLANNIAAELQEGRLFGPIDNPIAHAKISPIGVVPKPHSDKFRTINHLSYPFGTSINDGMTDGTLYTQYDRLDSAANWIRYFGKGCYLAKLDIESAFRNLPVHPLDVPLQYIQFEGKAYADLCLVFGSRSSRNIQCGRWSRRLDRTQQLWSTPRKSLSRRLPGRRSFPENMRRSSVSHGIAHALPRPSRQT